MGIFSRFWPRCLHLLLLPYIKRLKFCLLFYQHFLQFKIYAGCYFSHSCWCPTFAPSISIGILVFDGIKTQVMYFYGRNSLFSYSVAVTVHVVQNQVMQRYKLFRLVSYRIEIGLSSVLYGYSEIIWSLRPFLKCLYCQFRW